MHDDLLDAYASIEWAESQLDTLRARIGAWLNDSPDVVRTDKNPQTGEEVWQIDPRERVPRLINAEAGAIINGVRSSLDLLATTLAQRHCKRLIKEAYFPICGDVREWDGRGLKRIKRLSATDQATIKDLQPCFGGDNLLLALNQLDNIRKHQRLISFFSHSVGMSVYKVGSLPSELDAIYRTQAPENGYVLARNVSDPDYQIQVRVEITFSDIQVVAGRPVEPTLWQFAGLARSIIKLFDT
jgi:hypothetical protein